MKISLYQTDIRWQSSAHNRSHIEELIGKSPESDLIILPEMFTTGFCTSPEGVAEKADTETLKWMKETASKNKSALAGSVAVEENGKYYNRFYFVKPDGSFTKYDKRHLFTYGGEHKRYAAGQERVVVEHEGFRILLQICYDLRFPVFARNTDNYDMIIYVASWPISRIEVWNTLLRARAIENACYVAGVNRTGEDPYSQYNGGTVLVNYLGKSIVAAEFDKEEVIQGEINKQSLLEFRQKFPVLNDADQFRLINI